MSEQKRPQLHQGHRARMKKRFLRDNGESMETHELLEMLLFACIPRRNTNDIAHALLAKFGSFSDVLNASAEDLQQIDGIGESSALHLNIISALVRRLALETRKPPRAFHQVQAVTDYIKPLFIQLKVERLYLLCFDDAKKLLSCDMIAEGLTNAVAVNIPKMVRIAIANQATWVILAHNHPNGQAFPSLDDISTTKRAQDAFDSVSVQLAEHFIVCGDKVVPILHMSQPPTEDRR
jgi:DNA repair protein RadC